MQSADRDIARSSAIECIVRWTWHALRSRASDAGRGRSGARRTTRRRFVKEAGVAALGLTALGRFAAPARGAGAPKIVVVGAGLAGLSAAYSLRNAGYNAEIHEASNRIGGRCWTLRGAFAEGQIVEHGGELIDQGHTAIRQLASGLGLKLDNLLQAEQNGTEVLGYFDSAPYTYAEMTDDIKAAWQKIHATSPPRAIRRRSRSRPSVGRELDNMSIVDWIEETVRGRHEIADRAAARRRLQHRVRRRVVRAERAQPALPARLPRARASSASSAPRTRSTTSSAATTRSPIDLLPASPARSRRAPSSSR